MSLEANKLFAGLLVAGITAMVGGMVSHGLVSPDVPEKNVIGVEVAADDHSGGTAEAAAAPAEAPFDPAKLASADLAQGEKVAKACLSCHSFDKGGVNKVGPNLWGVVGGKHAHIAGFAYSDAMKALKDEDWSYERMYAFLKSPKTAMPGTKMSFAGIRKEQDRYALIRWLRDKSDSPLPLGQ